jgi:tetrahydromethanopterin S-methyltransferase subunit F
MTDSTESSNRPAGRTPATVDVAALHSASREGRLRAAETCAQLDARWRQSRQPTVRVEQRTAGSTAEEVADLRTRAEVAESRADNLERALASNRRIGMAIGILLTRLHCSEEQAFDVLRQESMRRNVKVAELAEHVVYTGTL